MSLYYHVLLQHIDGLTSSEGDQDSFAGSCCLILGCTGRHRLSFFLGGCGLHIFKFWLICYLFCFLHLTLQFEDFSIWWSSPWLTLFSISSRQSRLSVLFCSLLRSKSWNSIWAKSMRERESLSIREEESKKDTTILIILLIDIFKLFISFSLKN